MESSSPRSKFKSGQKIPYRELKRRLQTTESGTNFDTELLQALENFTPQEKGLFFTKNHPRFESLIANFPEEFQQERVLQQPPEATFIDLTEEVIQPRGRDPFVEESKQPATYKKQKQAPKEGVLALLEQLRNPSFKIQNQSLADVINNKPWALGGPSTHTFLHPDRQHPAYPKQQQPPQSLEECQDMNCVQNTLLNLNLDNSTISRDYSQAYEAHQPTSPGSFNQKDAAKWNALFGGGEKLIPTDQWKEFRKKEPKTFSTYNQLTQNPNLPELLSNIPEGAIKKNTVFYSGEPSVHTFYSTREGSPSSPIFRSLDQEQQRSEERTLFNVLRKNLSGDQNLPYSLPSIYYTNKYAQQ